MTVRLTWDAPSTPNGKIVGYQVIYSAQGSVSVSKAHCSVQ